MKDYFFGGSTDWPVFWLVAAVSLLVMVGVSRLITAGFRSSPGSSGHRLGSATNCCTLQANGERAGLGDRQGFARARTQT